MTLFDKFDFKNPEHLGIHAFFGALWLVLQGDFTRAQLVTVFGLDDTAGNDKEGLDALQGLFTGQTQEEKTRIYDKLKSIMYLYEGDYITGAQAKTLAGF